jgi:hypothetical protein
VADELAAAPAAPPGRHRNAPDLRPAACGCNQFGESFPAAISVTHWRSETPIPANMALHQRQLAVFLGDDQYPRMRLRRLAIPAVGNEKQMNRLQPPPPLPKCRTPRPQTRGVHARRTAWRDLRHCPRLRSSRRFNPSAKSAEAPDASPRGAFAVMRKRRRIMPVDENQLRGASLPNPASPHHPLHRLTR